MSQRSIIRFATVLFAAAYLSGAALAGEKKLMHCFTFTEREGVTDDDRQAFFKATDELPEKIDGLEKVWYGKLRRPLRIHLRRETDGEPEYEQKLRGWGVCMEMADLAALEKYADHEAHRDWEEVYFKVREPGTTTFDILGQ